MTRPGFRVFVIAVGLPLWLVVAAYSRLAALSRRSARGAAIAAASPERRPRAGGQLAAVVLDLNTAAESFPSKLVASFLRFVERASPVHVRPVRDVPPRFGWTTTRTATFGRGDLRCA